MLLIILHLPPATSYGTGCSNLEFGFWSRRRGAENIIIPSESQNNASNKSLLLILVTISRYTPRTASACPPHWADPANQSFSTQKLNNPINICGTFPRYFQKSSGLSPVPARCAGDGAVCGILAARRSYIGNTALLAVMAGLSTNTCAAQSPPLHLPHTNTCNVFTCNLRYQALGKDDQHKFLHRFIC